MPHCERCGKETSISTSKCRSCAMRDRWSDPVQREQFTLHNRELLQKSWEDPKFRELQSKGMKDRLPRIREIKRTPEARLRQSEATKKSWMFDDGTRVAQCKETLNLIRKSRTPGESLVRDLLCNSGLEFREQFEVTRSSLGLSGPGRGKILDFYLPVTNIDLEIDGTSHTSDFLAGSDEQRDMLLSSKGYIVVRIVDDCNLRANTISLLKSLGGSVSE